MNEHILIAEDDASLRDLLSYNLAKKGYKVRTAADGEETILLIKEEIPDMLLLDWMMPGHTGIEICKQIRQNKLAQKLPIILLTAKGEEEDKIFGLESGADDYIVKPFSTTELLARIKAVLRRTNLNSVIDNIIKVGNITINLSEHKVYRDENEIHLGPKEFMLLRFLSQNPNKVYSREQLLDNVWGHGIFVELRTVDTHIRRLRKAINTKDRPNIIRTVRSAGYSLDSR